jgi:hypothetical protein
MAPPIKRHTYGPRRTTFDPKRPLYARRAFGTHQAGDLFDPAGIAPMRLAGMFSSRLLTHDAPPARVAPPQQPIAAVTDSKPGKRPRAGA